MGHLMLLTNCTSDINMQMVMDTLLLKRKNKQTYERTNKQTKHGFKPKRSG